MDLRHGRSLPQASATRRAYTDAMPKHRTSSVTLLLILLLLVGAACFADKEGSESLTASDVPTNHSAASDPEESTTGHSESSDLFTTEGVTNTSTNASTNTNTNTQATAGGTTDPATETSTWTSSARAPFYGSCESNAQCLPPAVACMIDDFGHGFCTAPCLEDADCPEPTSGEARPYCTAVHGSLCVLNCDYWKCPEGMTCVDTQYDGVFAGGHCHWP